MSDTHTDAPTWTLGDRLVKARHVAHMDQHQLAAALGIGRASIVRYEADRHRPTKAVLMAWAQVCGVPYEWLADDPETGHTQGSYQSGWIDRMADYLGRELVLV